MPAKPMRPLRTGPKRTTADAIRDAELRSGKSSRVVSISDLSSLTGYDRGTISRWVEKGLPVEGKGSKGSILIDVRALIEWREAQAAAEERRKVPESTEDYSLDLDAELKREMIKARKIATAERTGILVMTSIVETTFASCLNVVRQSVMGLPSRIERDLLGFPPGVVRKAKEDMTIQCRSALREAQIAMSTTIQRATKDRLAELGVEDDEDEFTIADPVEEEIDEEEDLDLKEDDDGSR